MTNRPSNADALRKIHAVMFSTTGDTLSISTALQDLGVC
jgi:hypothetical protein